MGNKSSKNNLDTINWNNINTDDVSSSIHYLKGIDEDAKKLVSRLRTNNKYENEITNNNNNSLYISRSNNNKNESDYSKTSPFISSEMYHYLIENSSENKLKKQKGGAGETSTTDDKTITSVDSNVDLDAATEIDSKMSIKSGSEEETTDDDEIKATDNDDIEELNDDEEGDITMDLVHDEEKNKDEEDEEDEDEDDEDDDDMEEMAGGAAGYTSSSAHTSESSHYDTTISVGNNRVLSDSIRTSDINMVSIEN